MVGATFHGVRIPGTINGMGFINALRGGNLLSFEWFSCCTCGRLLPYDTRHELLECSIHPGGSTLGEMARLIQPIITLLSPGFQAEGDSRERDWQLADGALERALRVTVEVLQGKQLVARGTPGGDGLWEVVRATLSGHLPRPGPSTRAFISTSNRAHLKGEDAHTYWVEKEVCRHISRAASLGAAIVNEGIQRRTSKRVPSDANHLVINNGKLDCRDAIRTRDAARATAPAPNIPTPPKLKPPSPSQPVPSMHCDIDRDGEASSVSRKCTYCPCEVDVGKRQCTLCISIRCDFCQSERWEREVDGTHICGACLADKCISCGMVDPIAVTPSGLCFTCVRDPAISAAATATSLALAAAIAAAADVVADADAASSTTICTPHGSDPLNPIEVLAPEDDPNSAHFDQDKAVTDEIRVWYQNQYNPSTDKRPHHELARLLTDLGENRAPTTESAKVKEGKRRPMTQLLQITPFHRRRMETRRLAPTLVQEPVGDGVRRSMRVGLDPSQRPALALFNRLMAVEKEVNGIISRGEVGEGREWEVETDLIRWMIREQIRMLDEEMVKQGWRGEGWTGRRFMEPRREGGREEGVEVEDEGEEGEEEEEEVKEETEEGHPGRGVEEAGKEKEGGPEDPRGLDTFLRVARIKSKFCSPSIP